jgi:hypothetical protein
MIVAAILGLIAAALISGYYIHRNRSKSWAFKTTDEMMQRLAAEAVDIAERNGSVKLDYSPDSIKNVEVVLSKIHDDFVRQNSTNGVNGLAMAFGAYIGEVIKRSEPGSKWERDDPVGGEKSYPIRWRGGSSFPCAWCYRRIINGPEDNVWFKYTAIKQRTDAKSTGGKPQQPLSN